MCVDYICYMKSNVQPFQGILKLITCFCAKIKTSFLISVKNWTSKNCGVQTVALWVNKPNVECWTCCTGFEWNKHRCTYVHWRIYSSRYLDTLLYTDELSMELNMHWKCSSLYTHATIEEKGWDCSQMYNWHYGLNRITWAWEPVNFMS